VLTGGATGHP